jgi:hypothetical protein
MRGPYRVLYLLPSFLPSVLPRALISPLKSESHAKFSFLLLSYHDVRGEEQLTVWIAR